MNYKGGFTIVETMIVLAVTGLIFLSAVALVSGRTGQAQFTTAIQNVQSQVAQTINEVSNGYYPNNTDFVCNTGAFGPVIDSGAAGQGTNQGCIFLGKVLQFNPAVTKFTVYTVVGLDKPGDASYFDAAPLLLAYGSNPPASTVRPITLAGTVNLLENGLNMVSMGYCNTIAAANCKPGSYNGGPIQSVAFLSSLSTTNSSSGVLNSGSQHLNMIPMGGGDVNIINTDLRNRGVSNNGDSGPDYFTQSGNVPNTVQICFQSATTNQSGLVSIGGSAASGGGLAVTLQIKSTRDCS